MKRKIVASLFCVVALCMVGCGSKQESAETKTEETTETAVEDSTDESTDKSADTLGGVYIADGELTSLPMGTCINGEQVDLVNVEVPLEDIFAAGYVKDDESTAIFENAMGYSSLKTALELKFQEEPYAIQSVITGSGTDEIHYDVYNDMTFSEMKEYVQSEADYTDYTETENGQAFYYIDNGQYKQDDLRLVYDIDQNAYLLASYKGPLAESLGVDQLAQNICSLITIIK